MDAFWRVVPRQTLTGARLVNKYHVVLHKVPKQIWRRNSYGTGIQYRAVVVQITRNRKRSERVGQDEESASVLSGVLPPWIPTTETAAMYIISDIEPFSLS